MNSLTILGIILGVAILLVAIPAFLTLHSDVVVATSTQISTLYGLGILFASFGIVIGIVLGVSRMR